MAVSSVSHVLLPYAQCCSRTPRQREFLTRRLEQSQSIRKLPCLPRLMLCTSSRRGRQKAPLKSIIRAGGLQNSAHYEDSRVGNETERISNYVATRTYRKALASLRVVGEALPLQVNAAMAVDGGMTAAQELARGKPMLVIETYNPGRFSEGSTVSTKLQAPTRAVLERAKSMSKNTRQFSSSGRAFAIAFQAVRLLKLSHFELCFFKPGSMKGMADYKEGELVGYLEFSDASTLSEIAKGVCSYALACVKDDADQKANMNGFGSRPFQNQPNLKQTIVTTSAVQICSLTDSEVSSHVETIVQEKSLMGATMGMRRQRSWWERPLATQAVVKTGVDAHLVDEFVPAHALKLKLPSNNFEAVGLQKTNDTACTIDLTHAQMMDLADVLDLYCGDPYTGSGENVSISLDIPRRSWTKVAQAIAAAGLATAFGGALLLGFLSIRNTRCQTESPSESIFDMAFSQKLKEMRGGEPVDEQAEAEAGGEQSEPAHEPAIVEPVYKSPSRVQFRTRTRYYS